ncbi:hypothetical protein G5B37_03005 [Rasiella rasia]|uniref:Uncharacterized protein n=1 Tax=Rasiella rasia TaxID=2744027 RepID=A0A6G6GJ36_9FLAO|nr:hypothetical protein [Rasiella rasia]QIE58562.1 hypothetical protein G5B37_03005 [Rasiella rasia]
MTEQEFLVDIIFKDLTNLNKKAEKPADYKFSEEDFSQLIERAAHYGLSLYSVNTWAKNTSFGASMHQDHNKKASDKRWYLKAYNTFKHRQEGLKYAATYKVPSKLLSRFTTPSSKEEE